MPKSQSASSTETILVPISGLKNGVAYDPTQDAIAMAFMPVDTDPQDSDGHPGSWQTWPGPVYYAACLVGPDNAGVVLDKGRWIVWVNFVDNPDVPWLKADTLIIT